MKIENFLFIFVFLDLTCNTSIQDECPSNSRCIGQDSSPSNSTNGSCLCISGFKVNDGFVKASSAGVAAQYCKLVPITTTETQTTTTSTVATTTVVTKLSTTSTTPPSTSSTTTKTPTTRAPTPKPTHHDNHTKKSNVTNPATENPTKKKIAPEHIFGGILLPIFLVALFLGSVFAARKYDLFDRIRAFVRNRRYNSQYEDVIMENDFDDPPLI